MAEPIAEGMVRPQDMEVARKVLELCPRQIAIQYRVCPLGTQGDGEILVFAAFDTENAELISALQQKTGRRVKLMPATEQDIMLGIALHYREQSTQTSADLLQQFGAVPAASATPSPPAPSQPPTFTAYSPRPSQPVPPPAETPPAENFTARTTVDSIIQRAIADRATDIHIEPHENMVFVRFRVDGNLYDHLSYDPSQHAPVISRIKILATLDISQNRMAQDGRFDFAAGEQRFDIRVSIIPLLTGQKAVLRLLPKGQMALGLPQLGMAASPLKELTRLISLPYGMIIATGPTGSGKTTTLYACLSALDSVVQNIVTVEDPVEYRFPRIGQIQVHTKIGLTFAEGLRMLLRQDPDIIMVGEIRDLETLGMAIHSALTGHLVFTTLHCNDAAAAAARMMDLGAEPFLVASSVSGILAQRLIRKLCPDCKRPQTVPDLLRRQFKLRDDATVYYQATGCPKCRNTGYFGRISVFEVMPMHEAVQEAIMRKARDGDIRRIMREAGIPSMLDDALDKVREGVTSLEEIMRAVLVDTL